MYNIELPNYIKLHSDATTPVQMGSSIEGGEQSKITFTVENPKYTMDSNDSKNGIYYTNENVKFNCQGDGSYCSWNGNSKIDSDTSSGNYVIIVTAKPYPVQVDSNGNYISDGGSGGRSFSLEFVLEYDFDVVKHSGNTTETVAKVRDSKYLFNIMFYQSEPVNNDGYSGSESQGGDVDPNDSRFDVDQLAKKPAVIRITKEASPADIEKIKLERKKKIQELKNKINDKLKAIKKDILSYGESVVMELAEPYIGFIDNVVSFTNSYQKQLQDISVSTSKITVSYNKLKSIIYAGSKLDTGNRLIINLQEATQASVLSFNSIYKQYQEIKFDNNKQDYVEAEILNSKDLTVLESTKEYIQSVIDIASETWTEEDFDKDSDKIKELKSLRGRYKEFYKKLDNLKWDDSSNLKDSIMALQSQIDSIVKSASTKMIGTKINKIDVNSALSECRNLKTLIKDKSSTEQPAGQVIDGKTVESMSNGSDYDYNSAVSDIDSLIQLLDSYSMISNMGNIEFNSFLETYEGRIITMDLINGDSIKYKSTVELVSSIKSELESRVVRVSTLPDTKRIVIGHILKYKLKSIVNELKDGSITQEIRSNLKLLQDKTSQLYEAIMSLFKSAPSSAIVPMASTITTPMGPAVHVTNMLQIQQAARTIYSQCQTLLGIIGDIMKITEDIGMTQKMSEPIDKIIGPTAAILATISLITKAIGG
jgi:phosphopantetheine adenylyltransferase